MRQEEGLVLWWLLLFGSALGLLTRYRLPPRGAVPVVASLLLAGWMLASFFWTDSDERALAELARVVHYLGIVVLIWIVVGREAWKPASAGLCGALLVVGTLSLGPRLMPSIFPDDVVGTAFENDRLSYPLDYWNGVAIWNVMAIAVGLAWSANARSLAVRAAALALTPACGLAIYLTYSRQSVAGVALAIGLVVALSRHRATAAVHATVMLLGSALAILVARGQPDIVHADGSGGALLVIVALLAATGLAVGGVLLTKRLGTDRWRVPRRQGALAGGIAIVVVSLSAVTFAGDRIDKAWDEFQGSQTDAAVNPTGSADPASRFLSGGGARKAHWESAFRAFKREPVLGYGPGTFEFLWNKDNGREFIRDAHSLYLEQLAELGFPGLLFVIAMLGSLLWLGFRAWRQTEDAEDVGARAALIAVFALFVFHAGIDWMWEITAVAAVAFAAAALAAIDPARLPIVRGWRARAVMTAAAAVALLLQLPGLAGTTALRESQERFNAGDNEGAIRAANDAIEAEPWAASPYTQRALVYEAAGALDSAADDLRRAAAREPADWRPRLLLARVEITRGNTDEALSAFREARELRPQSRLFSPIPEATSPAVAAPVPPPTE